MAENPVLAGNPRFSAVFTDKRRGQGSKRAAMTDTIQASRAHRRQGQVVTVWRRRRTTLVHITLHSRTPAACFLPQVQSPAPNFLIPSIRCRRPFRTQAGHPVILTMVQQWILLRLPSHSPSPSGIRIPIISHIRAQVFHIIPRVSIVHSIPSL
ncbi:hypothetical protein PAXRUDRAFT_828730 [Paxillus rubicundulus Ve08.2h10]|uniref:Uncharacterized protein n=1 Tax=Paxillus rubicundulus Ve08.2h10 TaxID=930991 RepID=A0A0D0E0X6_9AGAM|nr:hypothetical protein PAXRUDRAFT_828730 [Paxillus rubicundulus Ve08.2h10]